MSYETYTTEALVCGTWNRNTSDKSYLLFTKEAGMLYADARSVREEKSKQRYALQDFSYIRVSLIKGKSGWRVGSVESLLNHYTLAINKLARGSVIHVYRILRRFYKGEESNRGLFEYVVASLGVMTTDVAERITLEQILQLRILSELGYVDTSRLPPVVLEPLQVDSGLVNNSNKKRIESLLKHATDSTQL